MEIKSKEISATGVKFYIEKEGKEIARACLYLLTNLHDKPFGLMEDVFVEESLRGQGIGSKLIKRLIEEAKKRKCYKLIGTSRYVRPEVHKLYERHGFKDWGKEFRIDF